MTDLTPEDAKLLWQWQRRRSGDITKTDYILDAGFGGPMPLIGEELGNLRFYLSHFNERDMFIVPLSRDAFTENHTQLKLTADITPTMKLLVLGLYGEQYSVSRTTGPQHRPAYHAESVEIADLLSSTAGMNSCTCRTINQAPSIATRSARR
jgi:hypothetical protein